MGTALEELERFQTDRLLHKQEFNLEIASMNILEELLEAHGVHDNKERILVRDMYLELIKVVHETYTDKLYGKDMNGVDFNTPTIGNQVDAFCDIQVFAGGEVNKLGYSNEKCLIEVGKEINSRVGEIVDGKFTKDKSPEAMKNWYKADFSNCKL
ncbi:MAG: hypothetical protein K0U20_09340 [Proteobacteria bacterium]|nr:hypothetical protein [Pseudomonadota bacterium]MCH9735784.1 hypothetical protein [Actinomycetes bacterium]